MKSSKYIKGALLSGIVALMGFGAPVANADQAPGDKFKERIPVGDEAMARCVDEWMVRANTGVSVWFFKEEDTELAPALHFDFWNKCSSWNFRVGVEGAHVNLDQEAALPAADGPGSQPRITLIRIPLAVEYMMSAGDNTRVFVGGGPDLIKTANDISDFSVGGHLGLRLQHDLTENWGLAVEGGYMWASAEDNGADVDLDGAYVTPTVTYTF